VEMHSNELESQILIVLSADALNILSGDKRILNARTTSICPFKVAINTKDVEFHTFIVLSTDALTINSDDGIIAN
jgi:hypothetical protein